ncbi:MAG TPA: precorrin-3B C(17)-methyltransferase [Cyanobacteria bacterium UBA11369]|nr:precorrin-3B C(17)-methyltransferase [Cyanobacteria bacterium UBA11371]HBE52658.1 precorrin-3B C(17)-methyltransferase [Cyanobacteria bacterium UBA11369]
MVVLFQDFQPLAAIATTPTAAKRLLPLALAAGATLWIPESLAGVLEANGGQDAHPTIQVYAGSLKTHLATIWHQYQGFIFGLAAGAVVRLISPLLEDKSRDPAVVVVDEMGQFAISLCSGHQGGADRLARLVALQIGATPVLSGASVGLGLPAVDMLGVAFGWTKGEGNWTLVAAAIARGEPVEVIQEVGSTLWQKHLPKGHPFYFETAEEQVTPGLQETRDLLDSSSRITNYQLPITKARIWIGFTQRRFSPESELPKVQWHPRVLWVGIGCERGTSRELIETAIERVFQAHHLAMGAIAGIATIDIKASEAGLVELCCDRNWPLQTFPAEILRSIGVPTPSTVVEAEVGTKSVAEAAAIVAAQESCLSMAKGEAADIVVGQESCLSMAKGGQDAHPTILLVPKQIFRLEGQPGAVTVAVALAEKEYTGRTGCLYLVGTGPGELNQITPAAQTAISSADAVIGYSLYIDLISPLLRPGQIVEALPITQERQRAQRAIELARWGLTVAVVSSGDCGIYGMAGLVLEELRFAGWDGKIPRVQVFPGISALQAAASRVGAPLMHDFCAISLSDLLTPWSAIEKRLTAAAMADFVTALYNPKSANRTEKIVRAQEIFLQYRDPNTPVAIVRSAYRQDEQISITTLDKLLSASIDMLTVVLIGNSNTRNYAEWMITPRGYQLS